VIVCAGQAWPCAATVSRTIAATSVEAGRTALWFAAMRERSRQLPPPWAYNSP